MISNPLPRLDSNPEIREKLLPFCRLQYGEIWEDPDGRHKVGCLDASKNNDVEQLMDGFHATLAIQDPPYNLAILRKEEVIDYIAWSRRWLDNTLAFMSDDSALYIWLGADQKNHFQPLPDFMIMMRDYPELTSRSFITMRNQRGYGTQKNWMAIRQELLYYTKGVPLFDVQYTDIPKVLRGYYKNVGGKTTENMERGRSNNIRAGNVWVDVQQVFYRMHENVSGCYAQKPLLSIERIVKASSRENEVIVDYFSHSGTTLIACEKHNRRCFTMDIDPIYCEITIRRLELLRKTGKLGWQNNNPFSNEMANIDEKSMIDQPTLFTRG